MKHLQKILSVFLALIMILSVLPIAALAEDETQSEDTVNTELQDETADYEIVDLEESDGEQETVSEEEPYTDPEEVQPEPEEEPDQAAEEAQTEPEAEPQETAPEFTVIYHSNFNNGTEESSFSQTFGADEPVVTALNCFSLENATFISWNTSPRPFEQQGTEYAENQQVDVSLYPQGVLELYAQWQIYDGQLRIIYNPLYTEDLGTAGPKAEILANVPEYQGGAVPFSSPYSSASTDYEAAIILRQAMIARSSTCTINVDNHFDEDMYTLGKSIVSEALRHTGAPKEGDYITWQGLGISSTESSDSGIITYNFSMSYVTTAAQEAQVDTAVASLRNELGLSSLSGDYEKIRAVHDWMADTANIYYDSSTDITHTAYGAIINGNCCCQGYAQLFYRLMCEEGIDSRVIRGEAYFCGSGGGHAWNIVEINGTYYNMDVTWDSGPEYDWFLRGTDFFLESHYCETFYLDALADNREYLDVLLDCSADIHHYNMSATDYVYSTTHVSASETTLTFDLASGSSFKILTCIESDDSAAKYITAWWYGDKNLGYSCSMSGQAFTWTFTPSCVGKLCLVFSCVDASYSTIGMTTCVMVNVIDSSATSLYTVTYDADGGTGGPATQKTDSDGYVELSTLTPQKDNYTFLCWLDADDNLYAPGTCLTLDGNLSLTAYYNYNGITVTFDANGGSCDTGSTTVFNGSKYGTLPTPTDSDRDFLGWFTTRYGKTRVTENTLVTSTCDHTLYAHWSNVVKISDQPTSVQVKENSTACFTVVVSGFDYTCRWQKSINGGKTWTDITNSGSTQLEITATRELDGAQFRCVISYEGSEIESNPAVLSVIPNIITADKFPDAALLAELSKQYPDGLTQDEAAAETELSLAGLSIANLKGIEYFTSLTTLDISNNNLKSADLSALTKLTTFNGAGQQLTAPVTAFISADGTSAVCDISGYYGGDSVALSKISATGTDTALPATGSLVGILASDISAEKLSWSYNTGNGHVLSISAPLSANSVSFGELPEYVTVAVGESCELPVLSSGADTDAALESFFSCFKSHKVVLEGDACVTVAVTDYHKRSEDSYYSYVKITGDSAGTTKATVTIMAGDIPFASYTVRIDVYSKAQPETRVTGVSLDVKKTTVKLYSTDYAKLNVLLELSQLSDATTAADKGTVVISDFDDWDSMGCAIESVEFRDYDMNELFEIRVLDDRQLEIVPRYETVRDSWVGALKLKGSYKSDLVVWLKGSSEFFITGVLTITINKTVPKLKANAVVFNTATANFASMTENLSFTGAEVTAVSLNYNKPLVPAWLSFNYPEQSVTYTGIQGYKATANVNLTCELEGWAVSVPVTLKVSAVNKAPSVKLKGTGAIEKNLAGNYVALKATVTNGTAVKYSLSSVYTGSKNLQELKDYFVFDEKSMTLALKSGAPVVKGSYKAIFKAEMRDGTVVDNIKLSFTVKETKITSLKPKFTLSSTAGNLFLNDKYDETSAIISCVQTPLPNMEICLDTKSETWFRLDYNEETGMFVIGWKENALRNLKLNSSKTVKLQVYLLDSEGNRLTAKPCATLNYKITICGN